MDRRIVLAILLMIGILFLPMLLFPPKPPSPAALRADSLRADSLRRDSLARQQRQPRAAPAAAPVAAPAAALARTTVPADSGVGERVTVASQLYRYTFSTRGARLVAAEPLHYKSFAPGETGEAQLIPPDAEFLAYALVVGNDTLSLADWRFTPSQQDVTVGADSTAVDWVAQRGPLTVRLQYVFTPNQYLFDVRGEVSGFKRHGSGHYYLALPFKDISGRNSWQWRIRGRSFRFLAQRLLPILEYQIPAGLDVLDLGAGNCWLSYRLASRGHRPVAVDLMVNQLDGMGAARHYFPVRRRKCPRFQSEIDRLPCAKSQFDLAVFNASFHYSEDYNRTLEECLRCLRRPGHIIIMDSPLYEHEESGEQMLKERHAEFERKYGFRSDSVASREYLTPSVLEDLGRRHGITWTILHPWYGLKWAVRPLRAWLRRRREPARFQIIWGTMESR